MSNVKIEFSENGPIIVKGLKKLQDAKNQPIEMKKDVIALCRCGASKNKPFCDGAHRNITFSDKREIDKPLDKEREYVGDEITIHDNRTICAHAAVCIADLPGVFKKDGRPWIDPNGASATEVIELIKKCPSGALSYTINNEIHREFIDEPQITVAKDASYDVAGFVELVTNNKPPVEKRFSLCRCGASKNKPYCDGTHHSIGFKGD